MSAIRRLGGFRFWSLIPFVVVAAVFGIYPFLRVVQMAFGHVSVRGGGMTFEWRGLENFHRALEDDLFHHSLAISGIFVVATTVISLVLGTALAILTDRATKMQNVARNVLVWPAIIAPVVVSVVWVLILNPQIGVLNQALSTLGLPEQGWLGDGVGAMAAIIAVDVWHWTPIVYLLIYSALKGIDSEVLEAASVDGANRSQTTRHVVIPMLLPAIAAAAVLRVVMGVKAFDEMYLLTRGGPGDSTTIISLLIRGIVFDEVDLGYGSAVSLVTIGIVLVMAVLIFAVRPILRRRA
ncbi:carbohydrate ABC transporter permease [Tessaracoccus antarcticus]|uniref:Sugar ABC transporter permease n=1 Tax=Tessaracoccus antarcticus TaxID=2479848 RepID=A0A3M0FXJ1_9ACTN|nr:sugar ABC transporter permease [Tessaracoccus antarcticus]RMB57225.1 sugar ABC transporter permease [Tessaracoccus antarcticus]